MTYLTGQSAEAMSRDERARKSLIINSLAFVAGFTIVFVLLGAAATKLGSYLLRHQHSIRRISGILIILFGLFHAGWIPIRFLNYERQLQLRLERRVSCPPADWHGFQHGMDSCIGLY